MRDFRDAKAMAHALRDALKSRAIETTHSDTLELIAKAFGYDNWNILSAKIEAATPPPAASGALSSAGAADLGSQKTLYCSFCGKSQHDVRKLIAGPLVYICDGCVQLCTDIVKDEDIFQKIFSLLTAEKGRADGHAAALEHLRGRPTDDLASFMERSKQFAEHNRLVAQYIRRRLAMRPDEEPRQDDGGLLKASQLAFLKDKSTQELLALQERAENAVKRSEEAARLGTRVLGERERESRI
jgi:hypothetical protein